MKTLLYEHPPHYKIWRVPVRDTSSESVRAVKDDDLSDEQRARYFELTCWLEDDAPNKDRLRTLGGFAGTGKTTLISHLARNYGRKRRIAYVAFTGKATNLLRARLRAHQVWTDQNVMTLHSLLYKPVEDERSGRILKWERRTDIGGMYDLIVVDEASMVDEEIYNDLMNLGPSILAVGDHGQLPPVNGSFNLMENPQLRLEQVHRQASESPIIGLSQYVRHAGRLPAEWTYPGLDVQIVSRRELHAVLKSLYAAPGINPLDVALLAFSNRARTELNKAAREIYWNDRAREGQVEPRVGDTAICLKNVARTVFNGMRGRIIRWRGETQLQSTGEVEFPEEGVTIEGMFCNNQFGRAATYRDFDEYETDTGVRLFSWSDMGLLFDFGYALTVHKSQGSGFKYVVLYDDTPISVDADTYRRWLYTGVTRCSSHLIILR